MSANKTEVKKTQKPITIFAYRNIKKEFNKFEGFGEPISPQYHLELGEKNCAVKVTDRKRDWAELADKDADKVGLANILKLMSRGQLGFGDTMFQDSEALDTSVIPDDISQLKGQNANAKLEALAKKFNCTVDELVDSFIKGTLTEFIESHMTQKETVKEEGDKNGASE